MEHTFPTDYKSILEIVDRFDPIKYGKSRNYVDGMVSYLSPYISRGVISTRQVLEIVLSKGYQLAAIGFFVRELCWRDYFQRVGQEKDLNQEIKHTQQDVLNNEIPLQILNASTGIEGIDNAIENLYNEGYMHNHCRMYTASVVCNIAKSHWHNPAQWMYYYLLDGDWASNACNWQWVSGANSSKKYYANQENINKYTDTNQFGTFLSTEYEAFETMATPVDLLDTQKFVPEIVLPVTSQLNVDTGLPTFVYNYYNLDPEWHKSVSGNRVLLIEEHLFSKYPVSKKCIDFMLALGENIAGLQVYVGSFQSLANQLNDSAIYYKEHPLNIGYKGIQNPRDWISTEVTGYYPSFFSYWKKIEKVLYKTFKK